MKSKKREFDAKPAVERLLAVVAMLRDREFGCPWDLEQSFASLAPHTLEEAYEVVEAIEGGDMDELRDELGDLLFQVAFYAQLAAEDGRFSFEDVAGAIADKLVRRHPHVFPEGDVAAFGARPDISSEQVVSEWDAIKRREREARGEDRAAPPGLLDGVPRAMPALDRALRLQKRAARAGFDWTDASPVLGKLREELGEFEEALAAGDAERMRGELGDVLFAAVNLSRHAAADPESALRAANRRFEERFRWIEAELRAGGRQVGEADFDELNALWDRAKEAGL